MTGAPELKLTLHILLGSSRLASPVGISEIRPETEVKNVEESILVGSEYRLLGGKKMTGAPELTPGLAVRAVRLSLRLRGVGWPV